MLYRTTVELTRIIMTSMVQEAEMLTDRAPLSNIAVPPKYTFICLVAVAEDTKMPPYDPTILSPFVPKAFAGVESLYRSVSVVLVLPASAKWLKIEPPAFATVVEVPAKRPINPLTSNV